MATNKIYVTPGTSYTFKASGGDVLWTPNGCAAVAGRISSAWDRGLGAKPAHYRWQMQTKWASAGLASDYLRLNIIFADAAADPAQTDCGFTLGDAGLTAAAGHESMLGYAKMLGVVEGGTAAACRAGGDCWIFSRYVGVACWNASASVALSSTATDHVFTFTEIPDDIQA